MALYLSSPVIRRLPGIMFGAIVTTMMVAGLSLTAPLQEDFVLDSGNSMIRVSESGFVTMSGDVQFFSTGSSSWGYPPPRFVKETRIDKPYSIYNIYD